MIIRKIIICLIQSISFLTVIIGQKVTSIDIVQAREKDMEEVNYFYEKNWLEFRKESLNSGYITGYKFIQSQPDSLGMITITLLTEYADCTMYNKREEHFRPIMSRISPNGPKYLNQRKNREFLKNIHDTDGFHKWEANNERENFHSHKDDEIRAIAAVLTDYIEGTEQSDQERLRKAFHPEFKLYTVNDKDSLWIRDGQQYINNFKPGQKNNRPGKILQIDYEKEAAQAKAEIYFPNGRIYTDYFLLMKYEDSWKIVQKSYSWRHRDEKKINK